MPVRHSVGAVRLLVLVRKALFLVPVADVPVFVVRVTCVAPGMEEKGRTFNIGAAAARDNPAPARTG